MNLQELIGVNNMENKINGKYVIIISKFNCQSYPLNDKAIFVSYEDLEAIEKGTKCFDVINNCVIDYDCTIDKRIKTISEAISERKKFLSNSDYQLFKYIEGEMTASEFEPIKSRRALWRKEINQLEEELKRYETI